MVKSPYINKILLKINYNKSYKYRNNCKIHIINEIILVILYIYIQITKKRGVKNEYT